MSKYRRQVEETSEAENGADVLPEVEAKGPSYVKNCFGNGFKVLVIGCIIFCAAITIGLIVDIYYLRKSPNSAVAVVTSAPECTSIATGILSDGGNAVDATVAAMVCLTVVRPDQSSLASGGYMLVHTKGEDNSLDFQFAAPKVVTGKQNASLVAIPGLLSGLQTAHKKYGMLPFSNLVQPSIQLASNGFVVSNSTALHIKTLPEDMKRNFVINGKLVQAGERLQLKTLWKTLSWINKGNYSLADDIVKTVTARSGGISMDDFNQYKPLWKKPLVTNLRGNKVMTPALPSSGVLLLSALNILNEFPKMNISMSYFAVAEVLSAMLSKQSSLQDPQFDTSQANITDELLSRQKSKEYAGKILLKMKTKTMNTEIIKVKTRVGVVQKKSSVSVSIIDASGNSVSAVSSLGGIFGSKIMTESGIILNDGISMFSKSGKINKIEYRKRPLSDASPALISNKNGISSFSPCADQQGLAAISQVLKDIIIDGSTEESSIRYPRLFFETATNQLHIEDQRFSEFNFKDVVTFLKSRFQKVVATQSIGSVSVAVKGGTTYDVVLDKR